MERRDRQSCTKTLSQFNNSIHSFKKLKPLNGKVTRIWVVKKTLLKHWLVTFRIFLN